MEKWQKHKDTSHIRELTGQPFHAGNHTAAMIRQDGIVKTNVKHKITKKIHQRSTTLERSVKTLDGFNVFNRVNIILSSDVDKEPTDCNMLYIDSFLTTALFCMEHLRLKNDWIRIYNHSLDILEIADRIWK